MLKRTRICPDKGGTVERELGPGSRLGQKTRQGFWVGQVRTGPISVPSLPSM